MTHDDRRHILVPDATVCLESTVLTPSLSKLRMMMKEDKTESVIYNLELETFGNQQSVWFGKQYIDKAGEKLV